MKKKQCSQCKLNRWSTSYYYRKNGTRISPCKDCSRHSATLWQKKNHYKAKRANREICLARRYGLSLKDFGVLLHKQEGKCAICERHYSHVKRVLCVDHNHQTGQVRGLLCDRCNTRIGVIEDIKWMEKGQQYLKESLCV